MTGPADKREFAASFTRLMLALKHGFRSEGMQALAARQIVYFDSLEDLSIEAVVAAEKAFRTEGSSDGWFPSTVEWVDLACEYEVEFANAHANEHKALPPSPRVIEAEVAQIHATRTRVLGQLRAAGFDGVANLLESFPVRHISESTRAPYCLECSDSGQVLGPDGRVANCPCVVDNPKIRLHRATQRRQSLLEGRRRRARQLAPSGGELR